jgi:iron(III) transport system substrate-binding protein
VLASVGIAALLMAGCASSNPTTPTEPDANDPLASLIKDAQAEGQLTVYGSPGEPGLKAAVDAFSQKYGIQASYVRIVGGELSARYLAEKEAGAATADAILINLATFVPDALDKGLLTPLPELDIPGYPWDFPEQFLLPEYGTAVVGLQVRGITYNTNFVKDGEITDWKDILDPKYKGHIGIPDPGSAAVYVGHWYTVGEHYGGAESFLTQVGAQLAPNAVYASGVPASAAVGAGEVWIVPMNIASTTKTVTDQGAPLGFVVPENTTTDEQVILVNSEPAHPNAAKLFAAFMMSPEGAGAMAENNNETSPFDTAALPKDLWSWPLELADEQKSNVVEWLTGK